MDVQEIGFEGISPSDKLLWTWYRICRFCKRHGIDY